MKRRSFLKNLAACSATLSLVQYERLLAAVGFHEDGPYNGPLITTYTNSTCGACRGGCGIRVRRVDDIPVKIDGNPLHPVNRGGLCPVGASSLAFLVHPDRIKTPLLRTGPRGSGEYKPIGWDEAETLLTEKLSELTDAGTPERLLYLDARSAGPAQDLVRKFVADFGSPNYFNASDPVNSVASTIWGGESTKIGYDLENARIIFAFGSPVFEGGDNPVYHAGLRSRLLEKPEGSKGSVFIIDSRLSVSAAKAERWVPIHPGTHGLLALGMLYLIIKEELYDRAAVKRYCVGFDDHRDANGRMVDGFRNVVLRNYYPGLVSERTGVPVDQIIGLARRFANTPGAVALAGAGALETIDGVYQAWAIMALNAVTGRIGTAGGVGKKEPLPFEKISMSRVRKQPLVAAALDDFPYLSGSGAVEALPDLILSASPYPIQLAIIDEANPVYQSVRSSRFRQAIQNVPFSVVFAYLHNETSGLVDLVLPDCTFLERHDLVVPESDLINPVVSLMQPVITPLFEARQSESVIMSLAQKSIAGDWNDWADYASYLKARIGDLYGDTSGTLFSDEFKVSFESLLAERGWRRTEYGSLAGFSSQMTDTGGWWSPLRSGISSGGSFPTTSGKFYLDSKMLRDHLRKNGRSMATRLHDAGLELQDGSDYLLGAYRSFDETEDSQYSLALYPIELTTVRGDGSRLKSMADMVGYYEDAKWESWVELNPETAHELGLHDRQMVTVESAYGRQQLILFINAGLSPDVAAVPIGLGRGGSVTFGRNVNEILSPAREMLTGMTASRDTRVKVYA